MGPKIFVNFANSEYTADAEGNLYLFEHGLEETEKPNRLIKVGTIPSLSLPDDLDHPFYSNGLNPVYAVLHEDGTFEV